MTVLITGGAGFIGCNLTRRLLEAGHDIVVLDDLSTGYRANLDGLDIRFIEGSILDSDAVDRAIAGCHAVVHLAARPSVPRSLNDPLSSHEVNATGTLRILEAAREQNCHVVVASSSSVYGANETLPKSEDLRPMPLSPYAVSKLAAECYALAYARCFDLDVLAFRFFNVYGPYQAPGHAYAAVVPTFVSAALRGEVLPIHGDGYQTRDFTFVGSVTEVLQLAIERRVTSAQPVNLAFGTRSSLRELVLKLSEVVEMPLEARYGEPRPGDVRHSEADMHRLRELFPDAAPTGIREGLIATVAWHRDRIGAQVK